MNTNEQTVKEYGKASPEQIEMLKRAHGDVFELAVMSENGAEKHYAYIKGLNRDVYAASLSLQNNGQVLEAGELILSSNWVEGSEVIHPYKNPSVMSCKAAMMAYNIVKLPQGFFEKK